MDVGHFSFMLQTEIQAALICHKSIGNMEVQSRRDTSAQRPLGLIMFFICLNFAPPLPPPPMSWEKALDPIWDSIARTTNPMEWNGMK